MKKIGLKVSQQVTTLAHGAEQHTLLIMADFLNKNYDLNIIGCEVYPDELKKYKIINLVNYYHFPKLLRKILHIPMAMINTIMYAKNEKPDLLFSLGGPYYNGLAVLVAGKLFGIKTLVRTAEDHFNYYKFCENIGCKFKHYFINYLISGFVLRNSDYVLVVGKKSREHFILQGVKEDRIFGIPGPISRENFKIEKSKKELREELGLPLDKIIVFYGGAISGVKGANELPKIIKKVLSKSDNFFFCIVGSETNGGEITKKILSQGGKNCLLFPPKRHSELKKYFNAVDIMVFLTKVGVGYGQITIEATNAELPVVAYNPGLDAEWFFGVNCYDNINNIIKHILSKNYSLLKIPDIFSEEYIEKEHLKMLKKILDSSERSP